MNYYQTCKIYTKGTGETYVTGTGQKLNVHTKDKCEGRYCIIHNPSNHHMKNWKTHWRDDLGIMERICPHGIGHPDPDDLNHKIKLTNETHWGIHGCDGCCAHIEIEIDGKQTDAEKREMPYE